MAERFDRIWYNARLATMRGDRADLGEIERGLIAARDGRIVYADAQSNFPVDADAVERIDCGGRWITPGLVDCHTHLVFGGNRAHEFELRLKGASYEEIARAGGGIVSTVAATRKATEAELVAGALPRLDALIGEGATTVEIKSGYGLDAETEMHQLAAARKLGQLRKVAIRTSFLGAHALPPEADGDKDRYIDLVCNAMLPAVAKAGLADAVDAFMEGIAFSGEQTARVFAAARTLGLPVKLHADQLSNLGGAALAAKFSALSADHLEHTDEAGAAAMAKAGTVAVLLPGAFYFIRETQKPPVELFRKHGVPMALAQLMIEAGLPAGILNVVNGDKEAVDAILDDPDVKAIGFVGSTPIAQYIYERAAQTGKRCQCFGGAKNHAIIMPDADMDQAVDALIGAGYGSAGERCMAVSVAVPVGKTTADRLMEKLIPRVESLKIGTSVDPSADYGPLVTREAVEKVKSYIDIGVKEGATLAVDGRGFKMQGYENGFYLGGSLFDNVTKDMRIYKEEIFGPVLSVVRAKDYHEALALPSDHDYGNGVAIFTRDGDAARDFAAKVNVGMVGVNVPIPVPIAYYTFGGWKKSGFGDLNQHGPDSVRFYTKTKTVTSRWPSGVKDGAEFSIPTMK